MPFLLIILLHRWNTHHYPQSLVPWCLKSTQSFVQYKAAYQHFNQPIYCSVQKALFDQCSISDNESQFEVSVVVKSPG